MADVLDLKFVCRDLDRKMTVREYLVKLLETVWTEEEGFSGKRPFGNSGWKSDIHAAMIEAGLTKGKLDKDGYIEDVDEKAADKLILDAIQRLGKTT